MEGGRRLAVTGEDEANDINPHSSTTAANNDIPDITSFSTVIRRLTKVGVTLGDGFKMNYF